MFGLSGPSEVNRFKRHWSYRLLFSLPPHRVSHPGPCRVGLVSRDFVKYLKLFQDIGIEILTVVIKKTFTNNSQVFVLDEGKKRDNHYPSYELLSSVNIQSRWRAWAT